MKRDVSVKVQEIWASEKEEEGGKVGISERGKVRPRVWGSLLGEMISLPDLPICVSERWIRTLRVMEFASVSGDCLIPRMRSRI